MAVKDIFFANQKNRPFGFSAASIYPLMRHLRCLWLQTFVWLGHVESSYIGLLKYMPIPLNLH